MGLDTNHIIKIGILYHPQISIGRIVSYINSRLDCIIVAKSTRVESFINREIDVIILSEVIHVDRSLSVLPKVYQKYPDVTILYMSDYFDFPQILWAIQSGSRGCFTSKDGPKLLKSSFELLTNNEQLILSPFWLLKITLMHFPVSSSVYRDFDLSPEEIKVMTVIEQGSSVEELSVHIKRNINKLNSIIKSITMKMNLRMCLSVVNVP